MGKITGIWTDGGCVARNPSPHAGTWAWIGVDDEGEIVREHYGVLLVREVCPLAHVSNNVTELYAMVRAILNTPLDFAGAFYSDSHVTLQRIFHEGALNGVPEFLVEALAKAKARLRLMAPCYYCQIDGHPTKAQLACGIGKRGNPCSRFNVYVDQLCRKAGREHQAAFAASGDVLAAAAPPTSSPRATKDTATRVIRRSGSVSYL